MTSAATFDRPAAAVCRIAQEVRELVTALDDVPLTEALDVCDQVDGIIEAVRSRRLAQTIVAAQAAGQDPDKVARSAVSRNGKNSRRSSDLAAKRAAAVAANGDLAKLLTSDELNAGQLDNIAHAMQTDPSAATDRDLIDRIAERSVDQGRRAANDWATQKSSANDLENRHRRQRRNRTARTWWSADHDSHALTLFGDGSTIDQLWQRINAQERIEYQNDGGRDVPLSDHPRTRDQRRFDAAVALLLGDASPSAGRAATVLSIPWGKISGDEPDACCEQIGFGPTADSVVLSALQSSDLFVNITGLRGQTLWWGRTRRSADRNQFIALVLRDKGCVLCGADWQSAEAHHLMPWRASGSGSTDLDNLALVCSGCHHRLHDNHQTLYRDGKNGQWLTRAAHRREISPSRPGRKPTADQPGRKRRPQAA